MHAPARLVRSIALVHAHIASPAPARSQVVKASEGLSKAASAVAHPSSSLAGEPPATALMDRSSQGTVAAAAFLVPMAFLAAATLSARRAAIAVGGAAPLEAGALL